VSEQWLNQEPPDPRSVIVAEWLAIAEGDLATAGREFAVVEGRNLRAVALHAQQAVEKLMKAVLIQFRADAPRTHDLVLLNELLGRVGIDSVADTENLRMLTSGAVDTRYPGASVSAESAEAMLRLAREIWAKLRPLA
jgi:HEPN domain-containing protein